MGFRSFCKWSSRSTKCADPTTGCECYQFCADHRGFSTGYTIEYGVSLSNCSHTLAFCFLSLSLSSEFPSLSGNSQPQYQPPNQAIWQRNVQQTPVQRPQQQQPQHMTNPQASHHQQAIQQRHDLSPQDNDDMFTGSTHLQNAMNDYQQEGQSAAQIPVSRQSQTTSIEDFPPLGRNGTNDHDHDQRSPFDAFTNSNPFSTQQSQTQARQGLTSAPGSQRNDTRSSSVVDRHMSPGAFTAGANSRSPLENGRSAQPGIRDPGRDVSSC